MINVYSNQDILTELSEDTPDSVIVERKDRNFDSIAISQDLLLFSISMASAVPLGILSSWLWSKIENRKKKDTGLKIEIFINLTRARSESHLLEMLERQISAHSSDGSEK